MTKKYSTVLMDLDNTLWDFHRNSREALEQLFYLHKLDKNGISLPRFLDNYHKHNDILWKAYQEGRVEKRLLRWKRFYLTLKDTGIDSEPFAKTLDQEYLDTAKMKTTLVDGAIAILEYLSERYVLCLVTNGFNEVQFTKVRNSGLENYFAKIITSEIAGFLKPDPGFYDYVLKQCNTNPESCIAVGDDPGADISGAKNAGIDQIYFSRNSHSSEVSATYTIKTLGEIRNIL